MKQLEQIIDIQDELKRKIFLQLFFQDFDNFPLFLRFLFSKHFNLNFGKLHYELFEFLKKSKPKHGLAIAYPRGHGKSTIIGLGYTIWNLLYRKKYILYFSFSHTQAVNFVRDIATEFYNNEKLQYFYDYEFISEAKNELEIRINRFGEKIDCKIEPLGAGVSVRGRKYQDRRPDLIIFDDIEKDDVVNSQSQRQKMENRFKKVAIPLGDNYTEYILIGTVLHRESILNKILKNEFMKGFWDSIKYKALIEENGELKPARPEKWSLEDLLKKKEELGTIVFNQEFQNEPIANEFALIKPEWIKYWEDMETIKKIKEKGKIYIAVDPAISQKETADYTAIVVLGVLENKFYVLEALQGRWTIQEQILKIKELNKKRKPKLIGIETVAYQQALKQALSTYFLPIKGLKPDKDKVRRLLKFQGLFEYGQIFFHRNQNKLIDQLLAFPQTEHDDLVDALVYSLDISKKSVYDILLLD